MSHILLVDDEEAVCWALRRALTGEGHQVAVAASAEDAFRLAEEQRPDAVQVRLLRPVDGPHAALAEEVEEDVAVEDQLPALAPGDLVGLERGEPAAADQLPGQRLDVGELLPQAGELGLLRGGQQRQGAQDLDEADGGGEGHDDLLCAGTRDDGRFGWRAL